MGAGILVCNSKVSVAAGFGVSPSTLDFTVEKGSEASRQLIIYNTGDAAEFKAISSNPALVQVSPSEGIISTGAASHITVTATGENAGSSLEEITVSLSSHNNGGEVSLQLGTAIAVRLYVVESAKKLANPAVGLVIAASILLVGTAAYYISRRNLVRVLPQRT